VERMYAPRTLRTCLECGESQSGVVVTITTVYIYIYIRDVLWLLDDLSISLR